MSSVHRLRAGWLHRTGVILGLTICVAGCADASSTGARTTTARQNRITTVSSLPSSSTTPESVSVSSTTLSVGEQVSLAGGGCQPGSQPTIGIGQAQNAGPQATYPFYEMLGKTTVRPDGTWSLVGTVPGLIIGGSRIVASCLDQGGSERTYSPVAVTVTTSYSLRVIPDTSVHVGEPLTVGSVGGECDPISNPDVHLWSSAQPNAVTGPGDVTGPAGSTGPWSVTLVVPSGTSPGQYYVVAHCAYSRSFRVTYEPVPITVLG